MDALSALHASDQFAPSGRTSTFQRSGVAGYRQIVLAPIYIYMQEQFVKAVGAHGLWKGRLTGAIKTGSSEFTVEDAAADNQCEFGKWLYSVHNTGVESKDYHEKVRLLHATFHQEVSRVLSLALAGKRAAALKAMEDGSPYAGSSASLTLEMMSWAKTEVAQ